MSKDSKTEKADGIGAVAVAAILDGKTNEEALAAVKTAHPNAKTGMASINWYRNKLRSDGATLKGSKKAVPTSREMKKADEPKKPAAKKSTKKPGDDPLA